MKALVEKSGHNVTFISGYSGGKELSHPNVTDLQIPELHQFMEYALGKFDINYRINGLQPPTTLIMEPFGYMGCKELCLSPVFQAWMNNTPKIDLIISDVTPECAYGLAKKYNSKFAIFQTIPFHPKNLESYGIPAETSGIPNWTIMSAKPPLSFLERHVIKRRFLAITHFPF